MTLDLFEPVGITIKDRVNAAMVDIPPHAPGVYSMYDASDRILYVGKAKDLFKRVTSYRYARAKKTQRMLAHVRRIGFEVCKTEHDAILLENMLIRSIKPPFNHANKSPETYYYISTSRKGSGLEFRLSMRPLSDYSKCYGCFKGHINVRKGLGALIRLIMMTERWITSAMYLPQNLLRKHVPYVTVANPLDFDRDLIHAFFEGSSDELVTTLSQQAENLNVVDTFTRNFINHEIDALTHFYHSNPRTNYEIAQKMNLGSSFISQNELDDLRIPSLK